MTESVDHAAAPKTSAVELLAKTPLFGVLHPNDLEELAASTRTRTYDRGDIIFRKDDPGVTLYVIISGAVKISVSSSEGNEIILAILTKGSSTGQRPARPASDRRAGRGRKPAPPASRRARQGCRP